MRKFFRVLDKGCSGINGAIHRDAIKRIEVDDEFCVYAYVDGNRYLINGYGSRMEVEEFINLITEGVDFDIESKVREKCRTDIVRIFKKVIGVKYTLTDIHGMLQMDYCHTYCAESLEELRETGYIVALGHDYNPDISETLYKMPKHSTPTSLQYMVGGVFNANHKGHCNQESHVKSALKCGGRYNRGFPCYPDSWTDMLYDLLFDLGYCRPSTDEDFDKFERGKGREKNYNVFFVNAPESTYDEETEVRTYDVDMFERALDASYGVLRHE